MNILVLIGQGMCIVYSQSGTATNIGSTGHGGISHGDEGCPGYDANGNMGVPFEHHRGPGTHSGDTGKNGIVFTKDVVHHNDGDIYVSAPENEVNPLTGAMDINQLHDKLMNNIQDLHDATIARKNAELEAAKLAAEIADEKIKKTEEAVARLKQLDDQAAINEHKEPEILGKQVIPVANFTPESFPLNHHIRSAARKIAAIQELEDDVIEAQKRVAKLEDITDLLKSYPDVLRDAPKYKEFLDAALLGEPIYFPVKNTDGNFYIAPNEGVPDNNNVINDMIHDPVSGGHFKSPDGHTHFVDHGDTAGGNAGGPGNGEGPRIASPIPGDPTVYYDYPNF